MHMVAVSSGSEDGVKVARSSQKLEVSLSLISRGKYMSMLDT